MSRVLITGATGTVGALTARALLGGDLLVRVAVRDPAAAQDLAALGAEVVAFDYDDPSTHGPAFDGVDAALLISPFVEDPLPGLRAAVQAAEVAGVRHLVRLSAAGADPDASGLPGKHGLGERLVQESGLGWTVLRPTFFIDNLWKFNAQSIREQGAWFGAGAGGRSSWVAAQDVAEVAAAALRQPEVHAGQVYALTGAEALSDAELAGLVGEALGREVRYVEVGPEGLRQGMAQWGAPAWLVRDMLFLENVKAQGWAEATSPHVAQVLGRPPTAAAAYVQANAAALG
ncbi:MAG: SDR family oxidoreductase [Alphaproteobacteria bacterium]|nr:SDR family oxidoreductase [Alphaproteobacteria bacterium]MCB9793028.1 SDR family oxidoreductase [Alphaproteobacteria bacterium]